MATVQCTVYLCCVLKFMNQNWLKFGHLRHSVVNKKLTYCWETVRRESMPRIAEMDVEMTT